jgi:hypothetical protein
LLILQFAKFILCKVDPAKHRIWTDSRPIIQDSDSWALQVQVVTPWSFMLIYKMLALYSPSSFL